MGSALAIGLLKSNEAFELRLCDRNAAKLEGIAQMFPDRGLVTAAQPREILPGVDVVLLCTKPKDLVGAVSQMRDELPASCLLVSVAAGIELEAIESALGRRIAVARAMPNTAVAVLAGTTGLILGKHADSARDEVRLARLFGAIGRVKFVPNEAAMHVVAALSGSSPAYVFMLLEALIDAGVHAGLYRSQSEFFARGAIRAAGALADDSMMPATDLRAQITSPGGTTTEGVFSLEKAGFRGSIMDAVAQTVQKSKEIAKPKSS